MARSHTNEPGVVWTDVHKVNHDTHVLVQLLEDGATKLIIDREGDQWQSVVIPVGVLSSEIVISLVAALANNRA